MSGLPASPSTHRRILWLLAELGVVFLGVFTAFMLDDWRAARRDDLRREQILSAMLQEYEAFDAELRRGLPLMIAFRDTFAHRRKRGERPRLQPLPMRSGFSTGAWEAMLQAGGLDVLDAGLIVQIEQLHSNMRAILAELDRFNRLTDAMLTPNLDASLSEFYDPETHRLRQRYWWYPWSLEFMTHSADELLADTDSVRTRLQAHLEGAPKSSP